MSPLILLYIALVLIPVIFGSIIAWRAILARRTDAAERTGPLPRVGPSFEQQSNPRQER